MANGGSFPHPAYERHVLRLAFEEGQRLPFPHIIAASEAHTVVLEETAILSRDHSAALLRALSDVATKGTEHFTYAPEVEDLFFAVETQLIEPAGPEAGGNLQIARARNDLDAVTCRLMLRDRLLQIQDEVIALRQGLLDLASAHSRLIMAGITHTQPAQPTTLAHCLLGVLGPLERNSARLFTAWDWLTSACSGWRRLRLRASRSTVNAPRGGSATSTGMRQRCRQSSTHRRLGTRSKPRTRFTCRWTAPSMPKQRWCSC